MDNLTPPLLTAIREIRWNLLAGRSIKESINAYLRTHNDEFSVRLNELWSLKVQGHGANGPNFASHRAQALWDLIERAHLGQPILEPLTLLEDDVEATAVSDLEMHVATLPFKALIPLLLLQFPAFAVLLLGPLLRDLARHAFAIAALVFVLSSQAHGEILSTAAFKKMSRAKNVRDLDQITTAFNDLRVQRMACDLQLKERTVPTACYQALALEQKWGLSSKSHAARVRAMIDRRCAEAAEKFQGLDGIPTAALSSPCQISVSRARELRDYQKSDSGWPRS